jgi:hypothetical protein
MITCYSAEDVILLNDMLDPMVNNVNNYTAAYHRLYFTNKLVLFSNDDINKNHSYFLSKLVRFLAPKDKIEEFSDFVYKTPIKEMPLHINSNDNFSLIAKWRLKVGK